VCDGYLWKQRRSTHRCLDKWYENSKSKQWQILIISIYSCRWHWILRTFRCLDIGLRLMFRKQHISETLTVPDLRWNGVESRVEFSPTARVILRHWTETDPTTETLCCFRSTSRWTTSRGQTYLLSVYHFPRKQRDDKRETNFKLLKNKNQLDATYYFIVLLIGLTCFGHYYAHYQELATIMLNTIFVLSFLVCCRLEVRCG